MLVCRAAHREDTGVVIQQHGGLFGAKMIPQYDMGDCFCTEADVLPSRLFLVLDS